MEGREKRRGLTMGPTLGKLPPYAIDLQVGLFGGRHLNRSAINHHSLLPALHIREL